MGVAWVVGFGGGFLEERGAGWVGLSVVGGSLVVLVVVVGRVTGWWCFGGRRTIVQGKDVSHDGSLKSGVSM